MEGDFPEHMKCPICVEIPEQEIFQCKNGHIHCHSCATKFTTCPQCRADLGNKIRNRALEELLDTIKFRCFYKSKGCLELKGRNELTSHFEKCAYGGISATLCSFLGFDCKFQTNSRRIENSLAHLESHEIISHNGNSLEARFKCFSTLSSKTNTLWAPILLTAYQKNLIIVVHLINDFLAISCLSLQEVPDDFLVEFTFKDMTQSGFDIKWRTNPILFTKGSKILQCPLHSTSAQLLRENYILNTDLILGLRIITGSISIPAKKCYIIDMYTSSSLEMALQRSISTSTSNIKENCKSCEVSLAHQDVYACIECPSALGRFICTDCMSSSCIGGITNHVLVLLSNEAQRDNFRMANFDNLEDYLYTHFGVFKTDRYKIKELLRRKENVLRCSHCACKPDFICLNCSIKEKRAYCSKCFFLHKTGQHDSSHIYALAKTKYARLTVISFLKDKGLFFETHMASKKTFYAPALSITTDKGK